MDVSMQLVTSTKQNTLTNKCPLVLEIKKKNRRIVSPVFRTPLSFKTSVQKKQLIPSRNKNKSLFYLIYFLQFLLIRANHIYCRVHCFSQKVNKKYIETFNARTKPPSSLHLWVLSQLILGQAHRGISGEGLNEPPSEISFCQKAAK